MSQDLKDQSVASAPPLSGRAARPSAVSGHAAGPGATFEHSKHDELGRQLADYIIEEGD
ncbi:MAG: hypothetical protein WBL70_10105 [Candidatus Acidiferrales bacterium]